MALNLIETMLIVDGEIKHKDYHERRMLRSREDLFKLSHPLNLSEVLDLPTQGVFRCRVVYNQEVIDVSFSSLTERIFKSFMVVESDIEYSYKFEDRSSINLLFDGKEHCDDIIIIKNNLVTDTSIANIGLFLKDTWYTPKYPLLKGTTRQRYLDLGIVLEKDLYKDDLYKAEKFVLMNSILDFHVIENPIFI